MRLLAPLSLGCALCACDIAVGNVDERVNPAFATAAEDADAGVKKFHQHYAAGDYDKIWDESRQTFKDAQSKEDWVAMLEETASALGAFKGSKQETLREESYQGEPLITLTYISEFEQFTARESFQYVGSPDGLELQTWKIQALPE